MRDRLMTTTALRTSMPWACPEVYQEPPFTVSPGDMKDHVTLHVRGTEPERVVLTPQEAARLGVSPDNPSVNIVERRPIPLH